MAQDFYSDVIDNIKPIEDVASKEITPHTALDILEVSGQTGDPNKVAGELADSVKYGGSDISAIRNEYSKQNSSENYSAIRASVEANFGTRTKEENMQAIRLMQVAEDPGNKMFDQPFAGKEARREVDKDKDFEKMYKEMSSGVVFDNSEIDVRGGTFKTKNERDKYHQGLMDRYITGIFFLPMLTKALLHGVSTTEDNKYKDGFWSKGTFFSEKDIEAYNAWEEYQAQQAAKDPNYQEGNGWRGDVLSIVTDPFAKAAAAPFIATKLSSSIAKSISSSVRLSKIFGGVDNFLSLMTRSGDTLVDFFRNDEKMTRLVLEETARGSDPVSKRLFDAATTSLVEGGKTSTVKLSRSINSPLAKVADIAVQSGDVKAQDEVIKSVLGATTSELSKSQEVLLKAVDAGDALPLTLIPDNLNTVIAPLTKFGTDVNNATTLADVATNQILYNVMSDAQRAVADVNVLRISPVVKDSIDRAVDFGVDGEIWKDASYFKTILPGPWKFKAPARKALIEDQTYNNIAQHVLKKSMGKQMNIVYRGLSKGEEKLLNKLIYTADNLRMVGDAVDGGLKFGDQFIEATPRIIDRFKARQIAMKNTQRYLNSNAVAMARKKGWKTLDGATAAPVKRTEVPRNAVVKTMEGEDFPIVHSDVYGEYGHLADTELAQELASKESTAKYGQIYEVSKYDDPYGEARYIGFNNAAEADKYLKEMPDNHRLIGDIEGYQRVEYKDKYKVYSIHKDKNARVVKVAPIVTSDTWRDAEEFINAGKAQRLVNNKAGRKSPAHFVAIRSTEGLSEFAYEPRFWDDFSKMSGAQMEEMQNLFREGGLSKAEIEDLFSARDKFGYKRPSALKERDVKRLGSLTSKTPNVMLGKEADASYFNWVSRHLAKNEYMDQLEKSFVENYSAHFPQLNKDPYAPINPLAKDPLASEAAAYQKQLRTLAEKQRAIVLEKSDQIARHMADKFIRVENKTISKISEGIANTLPLPSQVVRGASNLTTTMALGSFGLVQLPLQFSAAAINAIGASAGRAIFNGNPKQVFTAAARAQVDFVQYLASKTPLLNKMGLTKVGKGMRETWDFVERSGISAGIDYDEVGRMLVDSKNMGNWTGFVKKPLTSAKHAGATFYKQGENLGQVYSLLMARRLLEAEGKYKVGSKAFEKAVLGRAKVLALNMSKHNSSGMTQNELSAMLLKFKDFGIHQGSLFVNPAAQGLTKGELVGLYATWFGLFGIQGIPFSWDALISAEMVSGKLEDSPNMNAGKFTLDMMNEIGEETAKAAKKLGLDVEAKNISTFLKHGAPAVANEELKVASRFAISRFFSDYMTATHMDEAALGAVYTKMKKFALEDTTESFRSFMNLIRDDNFTLGGAAEAAVPLTNQFSGVAGMIRAGKMFTDEHGVLRDTHGRALITQPTLTQKIMVAGGLTPGTLVKTYELRSILHRQKKAIKEYVWEHTKKIAQDSIKSQKAGAESFDLLCHELEANGYVKLIPLIGQRVYGLRSAMDKNLNADERLFLQSVQQTMDTGVFNNVMKELHGED